MKKLIFFLLISVGFIFSACNNDTDKGDVNPTCQNECDTVGQTRCSEDKKAFETCTKRTDTCNVWEETKCTGDNVCVLAEGIAGCGSNENDVTSCQSDSDCAGNTNGKTVCVEGVCTESGTNENVEDCTEDADCKDNTNGKTICVEGVCAEDDTNENVEDCTEDADCEDNTNGKTVCIDEVCTAPSSGDIDPCPQNGCDTNGETSCKDGSTLLTCTLQPEHCLMWEETECETGTSCIDNGDTVAHCGIEY